MLRSKKKKSNQLTKPAMHKAGFKFHLLKKRFMKALVFHTPKNVKVDTVDDPAIEKSTDVILKVTSTAICGSDLHIFNGYFPGAKNQVLGHEFMGEVVEAGKDVKN